METDRSHICGCKGIRTCLKCEQIFNIPPKPIGSKVGESYVCCPHCDTCWTGWEANSYQSHPHHLGKSHPFEGVRIIENFISSDEENYLITRLDGLPWDLSQSGRRKQNFGPKCNFKMKKLKLGNFNGFPEFTKFVQERFNKVDILKNYQTIEQCSLEYNPERGASIDPHIDDCWVWGERIVTLNLLADSVLTLTPYRGGSEKYNLSYAPEKYSLENRNLTELDVIIRIPMPARSLIVLYGEARYFWEHFIYREDITKRRVCIAYREFTEPYKPDGAYQSETVKIYEKANHFWT